MLVYIYTQHHLNHSNSTFFDDIVIHRDTIKVSQSVTRWLHLATSCSLPKTIGKLRVSIVLTSYGEVWCRRWPHEVKTMDTQTNWMSTRWMKWTHEVHTKVYLRGDLRQFFDIPKIFRLLPKLLPNPKKNQPAVTRWFRMQSRMTRCVHNHSRYCKFP